MTIFAPSVMVFMEDSIDVSVFFDVSEEEEEKSSEKNKELESFFAENNLSLDDFLIQDKTKITRYYFKKYPKPHLNLIFPPPEFI